MFKSKSCASSTLHFKRSKGEVDPLLKIPRPDGVPDGIGIKVLHEPIPSKQSNSAVIELQLRNRSKKKRSAYATVRSIENASKNNREVDQWIKSVEEIHETKPAPEVRYQNSMPSCEDMMAPLPRDIAGAIEKGELIVPTADMELTLEEYIVVLCCLLGIPVYKGRLVESVHALFNMYHQLENQVRKGLC